MIALYRPGSSILHRTPAGAKLIGLIVLGLAISLAPREPAASVAALGLVAAGFVAAGWTVLRALPRQLWITRWIVAFMVVTQLIFLTPLDAFVNTGRVLAVVLLAALLTLTTRSEDLLQALERGLAPLRHVGVDPRRLSLLLSLTISTIPAVADFARRVREAQLARGARLGPRVVIPLLVMSLRHADEVADALAARGVD